MGIGNISFGSLLLIFLIVALIFGTKRLRSVGEDLGSAMRSFRKGFSEGEAEDSQVDSDTQTESEDSTNPSNRV